MKDTAVCASAVRCLFCFTAMTLEDFENLFENADESKRIIMSGLIEEAYDCKCEIAELKEMIRDLKARKVKFPIVAKRERLLIQKRASYTNMMARICKELCAVNDTENFDDLEEYE